MSAFFIDTSALVKRYINEIGTKWMQIQTQPSSERTIIISELTVIEMFSSLARRQREQTISVKDAERLRRAILRQADEQYLTAPINAPIQVRARELVTQYPLRTLDAIQLACALQIAILIDQPITFLSADKNLLAVATATGFATDNPNLHS